MSKILVVNNHGQFCHLINRAVRELGVDVELVSNTLGVKEIREKQPDGLMLSGGPSMERTGSCMEYVFNVDLPILGICLGHQLIAKAYGGQIKTGLVGGYAAVEVEIIKEDEILKGIGPKTIVWASHADEVTTLPEGFVHLARSLRCEIEAMRHPTKPIFGVQWHPEVTQSEKGKKLLMNFIKICEEL
ncbi:MAG: GMP synthase [glutamine-hydrolyzing] subunit A [Candidatus Argoarchaeum ethanivorans]|uniref:GMP synthase [glutamine-hydrolyzing] subunit A n=1 Tax=Candidatus Argoarchaeum ethanivorans TaxID=2608793 RepID=A0A811T4C2_9EURY|nr:MAG: GMP synthase [glutamine-hydrolyzing] subunit A [Candidatus Argoarchaeum ethanivorans]CAD6492549.1 MAG: GMP synthase [glutamine-hydrolyzing] subunit A [Candidatus Argoarchaeum ethanivorans]